MAGRVDASGPPSSACMLLLKNSVEAEALSEKRWREREKSDQEGKREREFNNDPRFAMRWSRWKAGKQEGRK